MSSMKFDEMWVLPTRQNPLKPHTFMPAPEFRRQMVDLALRTLDPELARYKICEEELTSEGPSYTMDTLTRLIKKNSAVEFSLCIGADQFVEMDKWKNPSGILKKAHLVVTTRPGYPLPTRKSDLPTWVQKLVSGYAKGVATLKGGKKIRFVTLNDVNVSSTEIRRKIQRGENVTHLTPGVVVDYVREREVYAAQGPLVSDYALFTKFCADVITQKGGIAVNAYDVRKLVQPSEYTLVASGTSTRHARALAENVIKAAKEEYGIQPQNLEGGQEGRWVVVDYGALIIHLFYDFVRNEYHIEDLWTKGARMSL